MGTAVVTRTDGRLALGRLGALCEQVCLICPAGRNLIYILICSARFKLFDSLLVEMSHLQVKELNSQGFEVILVTSGAVGVGRQKLRYRRLLNSRSIHLLFLSKTTIFKTLDALIFN